MARELGERALVAVVLEGLAAVARSYGQLERAARLLGAAEALREAMGAPIAPSELPRHEGEVAALRDRLSEEGFERAWEAGRALTADEACAEAMRPSIEVLLGAKRPDLEEVRRIALIAEMRDDETGLHVVRMSSYAAALGREAGMTEEECGRFGHAVQLHDVGKIGVPESVLRKAGKLDDEEWAFMRSHPDKGALMLDGASSRLLREAHEICLTHHERWDGSGYPRGLRGEDIPLGGRIAAVADVFDALTSVRPYKGAWAPEDALAEIERCSGSHLDPELVSLLVRIFPEILELRERFSSAPAPG